jgi:chromosome segregation ATPase
VVVIVGCTNGQEQGNSSVPDEDDQQSEQLVEPRDAESDKLQALEKRIVELEDAVAAYEDLDQRIDQITQDINLLASTVDQHEQLLTGSWPRLGLSNRVNNIETNIRNIDRRLCRVEGGSTFTC